MEMLVALIVATSILVIIPGPNVALIVANSLQLGLRMGVITVFGTTIGVAVQLAFVAASMAALVELAVDAMIWLRWIGVVYLVWLGVHTWRSSATDLQQVRAAPAMFWRGCVLATINPKTLLFNAAFLPQFVDSGSPGQFALVAGVFLGVILVGDLGWALFASSARKLLERYANVRNKITGIFLTSAGIGLALAKRV